MTTVLCTPDEHAAIVGGATQLVVPGDLGHPLEAWDEKYWLAPQRWVDATGPCPTCRAVGLVLSAAPDASAVERVIGNNCPDCIDGRKRVALAVTCPNRHAFRGGWVDCVRCDEHGQVVFAHATVEVHPVTEVHPFNDGTCIVVLSNELHWKAPLDPLPVPGRDFVVVLDDVEMT